MSRRCELSGKAVLVGNNVSHANNRSKRRFLPNLQNVTLLSDTLGRSVHLRISRHAQRTVDKVGGLDNYVLQTKDALLSDRARRLKRDILKARA
ncbi:MAG: 50S ribosomal protein L28 [Alphaproteobacteria bacterium]|nr:50S ribosomal protein L28 [Alphaproteobacteria bacterium]